LDGAELSRGASRGKIPDEESFWSPPQPLRDLAGVPRKMRDHQCPPRRQPPPAL
jgi:hypothetical protein